MTGRVTDSEAVIQLIVHGSRGRRRTVEAVVDTGFSGWLTLPPRLIKDLGLPWRKRDRATLGDGSEIVFDTYRGVVSWDGRRRGGAVDEADTDPLIGMAMLDGYELRIQVCARGKVTVRPLRRRPIQP
jgi:clan AA aspartic protease